MIFWLSKDSNNERCCITDTRKFCNVIVMKHFKIWYFLFLTVLKRKQEQSFSTENKWERKRHSKQTKNSTWKSQRALQQQEHSQSGGMQQPPTYSCYLSDNEHLWTVPRRALISRLRTIHLRFLKFMITLRLRETLDNSVAHQQHSTGEVHSRIHNGST